MSEVLIEGQVRGTGTQLCIKLGAAAVALAASVLAIVISAPVISAGDGFAQRITSLTDRIAVLANQTSS